MTISSSVRIAGPYTGTGSVSTYPFSFKVFQATDVLVVQTDLNGVATTLAITTNYSVSLNADQNGNPGGSINLNSPLPNGYQLVISSQVQELQGTSLTNNGGFYPSVIENALDYLTVLVQQVQTGLNSALRIPLGQSAYNAQGYRITNLAQGTQPTDAATLFQVQGLIANGAVPILGAPSGSSLVGFLQAGAGAVAGDAQSKMRERVTPLDFMLPAMKADVISGAPVMDHTAAIQTMFASGATTFDFLGYAYNITVAEGTTMVTFLNKTGIRIKGDNATLLDAHTYTNAAFTNIFVFDGCTDCSSVGLNYLGAVIVNPSDPTYGVGYMGATFACVQNGCVGITIEGTLQNLRYGMRAGVYATPSAGYNKKLTTKLRTYRCGYPCAHYLSNEVTADHYSEGSHRSAYLAGVQGGDINVRFKDEFIAAVQVLVTDAMTGTGTSRGSSGLRVVARDMGSTTFVANSWACGITLSRVDPGTVYEDIEFHFTVAGTDTVATTLGGFTISSNVKATIPGYPLNWDPGIIFKDIRVSGIVDRSAQTLATHGVGEIYILTEDGSPSNAATVSGLHFDQVKIINGAGSNPRDLWCVVHGLTDMVNVTGCNFSNYTLEFQGPTAAPFNFVNCAPIVHTNANSGDTSARNFVNTNVTGTGQPLANTTFNNSALLGAGWSPKVKVVDVTLNGATTTATAAIPASTIVLGVNATVKTAITGATGFTLGTAGSASLYANSNGIAVGSTVTAISASSATTPLNYPNSTDLVFTAKTSNFTGGVVRLAIHYITFTSPS